MNDFNRKKSTVLYSLFVIWSAFGLCAAMEQPSTIFIPGDTSIGTWDPATRIYTLSTDVNNTIQIDEDDLTLDGAGYTVSRAVTWMKWSGLSRRWIGLFKVESGF